MRGIRAPGGTAFGKLTVYQHPGSCARVFTLNGGKDMKEMLRRLYREEAGQDLTEYALLMVLVALAAVTTMKTLANTISNVFSNAASALTSAT